MAAFRRTHFMQDTTDDTTDPGYKTMVKYNVIRDL